MAMVLSRSLILILAVHLPAAIHHAANGKLVKLYRIIIILLARSIPNNW